MPTKSFFKKNTVLMLKSFIYTAERKSLTEAGKILLLPVSSISRYITDLEKDMGETLIITVKGKTALTPQGQRLYRRANKLIKSWDTILSDVKVEKKLLRVASYASAISSVMPHFIKKMRFLMPHISLDIQMFAKEDFNKALRAGEVDLGIYAYYDGSQEDKEPDFMYKKVGDYEPRIIIHKDNLANKDFEGREELSVEELYQNIHLENKIFVSTIFMFKDLLVNHRTLTLRPSVGLNMVTELMDVEKGCSIFDVNAMKYGNDNYVFYKVKESKNMKLYTVFFSNSNLYNTSSRVMASIIKSSLKHVL